MYANKRLMAMTVAAFCTVFGGINASSSSRVEDPVFSGFLEPDRSAVDALCSPKSFFPTNYTTIKTLVLCGREHAALTVRCATEVARRMTKTDRRDDLGLNDSFTRIMNNIRRSLAGEFVDLFKRCDFSKRANLFSDAVCEQIATVLVGFVGGSAAGIEEAARRAARVLSDMEGAGRSRAVADRARGARERIESALLPRIEVVDAEDAWAEGETADLTPHMTAFKAKQRRMAAQALLDKANNFVSQASESEDRMRLLTDGKFAAAANDFAKVGVDEAEFSDECIKGLETLGDLAGSPRFSDRVDNAVRAIRKAHGKDDCSVSSADSTSIASDCCSVRSDDDN